MIKRLYYLDSTLCEFSAYIVGRRETERGPAVQLDQTAFYPTSGGQPHDTGTLNGIPVIDVWDDSEGEVWHLVEQMPESDEVTGIVDWQRRFDHMQQHTGQHILSAAFFQEMDANTIGFHLGAESSTIDLDIPKLTTEAIFRVEEAANRVIWENRIVTIRIITDDEVDAIPFRKPPHVTGKIRLIWVEGYDASACGGTHVGTTGEIGIIKITGVEHYKGGLRVTFLCGRRALRDYQHVSDSIRQVSADLSIHQDELREAIAHIQEEATATRRALNKARKELMHIEGNRLWKETPEVGGMRHIVGHWKNHTFEDIRTMATSLREHPHTVILLAVTEDEVVRMICCRSDDLEEVDASAILQQAMYFLCGRGGGSPIIAQGGAPKVDHDVVIETLHRAISMLT